MRALWVACGLLILTQGAASSRAQPSPPLIPAGQLVREVVYNELNDHKAHGYWRYWIERRSKKGTRTDHQVETAEGPVTRLALSNGRPLSIEDQLAEETRLKHLLSSPDEQARHRQEYADDEMHIGQIVALLPYAFLYEYDGEENGSYRLRFRPDPNYSARSIEARIFHAMSGELWVDARLKRMTRLDGHLVENVDFGLGILGRLYKGGWFRLQRTQVSQIDWKTEKLEVHMLGRAMFFKTIARETSEQRGGFVPVAAGMNLAEGMMLLQQTEADNELVTPVDLSVRR